MKSLETAGTVAVLIFDVSNGKIKIGKIKSSNIKDGSSQPCRTFRNSDNTAASLALANYHVMSAFHVEPANLLLIFECGLKIHKAIPFTGKAPIIYFF